MKSHSQQNYNTLHWKNKGAKKAYNSFSKKNAIIRNVEIITISVSAVIVSYGLYQILSQ